MINQGVKPIALPLVNINWQVSNWLVNCKNEKPALNGIKPNNLLMLGITVLEDLCNKLFCMDQTD